MNNKILTIVICVIVGAVLFSGTGYFVGVSLEKEKSQSRIETLEKQTNITEMLGSSKIINSVIAFGKVSKVSGRTVTLASGLEKLAIDIKEDAQIYLMTAPTSVDGNISGIPTQRTAVFGEIKVGDNINVNVKILSNGSAEGLGVIILPPGTNITQ